MIDFSNEIPVSLWFILFFANIMTCGVGYYFCHELMEDKKIKTPLVYVIMSLVYIVLITANIYFSVSNSLLSANLAMNLFCWAGTLYFINSISKSEEL